MTDPWGTAQAAGDVLRTELGGGVDLGIVLGSGWGAVADHLGDVVAEVGLGGLPGFVSPRVPTHEPRLVVVQSERGDGQDPLRVAVLLGRVHLYEGHRVETVVHPVRALAAAGAAGVLLTNAAGAIDDGFSVGDVVVLSDHLNCTGRSPLTGEEPPEDLAGRFVDLTDLYSRARRERLVDATGDLAQGVYAGLGGPHFETPAEIRALRTLGADLVGFSTVLEAIAARHAGLEVMGLSLVTNMAAGMAGSIDQDEVFAAAAAAIPTLAAVLGSVVRSW